MTQYDRATLAEINKSHEAVRQYIHAIETSDVATLVQTNANLEQQRAELAALTTSLVKERDALRERVADMEARLTDWLAQAKCEDDLALLEHTARVLGCEHDAPKTRDQIVLELIARAYLADAGEDAPLAEMARGVLGSEEGESKVVQEHDVLRSRVAELDTLLREAQDSVVTYSRCPACNRLVACSGVPCRAGHCACGYNVTESEIETVDVVERVAELERMGTNERTN